MSNVWNNSRGLRDQNGKGTDQQRKSTSSAIQTKSVTSNNSAATKTSGYTNLERFGEIAKEHQQGISRTLEQLKVRNGETFDSSDEEENIPQKNIVLDKIIGNYVNLARQESDSYRRFLEDATSTGFSTCLICICSMKRTDAVWNCTDCASSFHLQCIQKWSKDGVLITDKTLSDEYFPDKEKFWACPKCRNQYSVKNAPTQYFCYCGKVRDPADDPWILPHSCGQLCEKPLKTGCDHRCSLLCHPGPCPPCPSQVRVSCFCRKTQKVARCGLKNFACASVCGRKLSCGQHTCSENCHEGDCKPCPKMISIKCNCGSKASLKPCGTISYHCERVCGKIHPCGTHSCDKVCHKGDCGPCPRSLVRTCPCGKTKAVADCSVEILPCDNVCGKLTCDLHVCQELCHFGKCGDCTTPVQKTCPCGSRTKTTACSATVICDVKCKRFRNCQRHTCNKRCCTGNCPACDQTCGRPLNCKSHKCDSLCHSGPCYPCTSTVELSCNCGASKLTVPCGRQRSIKPPKCQLPCRTPPVCHHPERVKHSCHFGPCPPCSQTCKKELLCHHKCKATCHTAVEVAIQQEAPAGPWEVKRDPLKEIRDLPCPPCSELVDVPCLGSHDVAPMKCSEQRVVSCGRLCERKLECGRHSCQLVCHDPKTERCDSCESQCTIEKSCGHPCWLKCHPGHCPPCPEVLKFKCYCQSMTLKFSCGKFSSLTEEEKVNALSCKIQCPTTLLCGHPCTKSCHPSSVSHSSVVDCKRKVAVKCACGRIKEQQPCAKIKGGYKVKCDEECNRLLKAKQQEAEASARKEVEKKAQMEGEAQEKYNRYLQGRRRRGNREVEEEDTETFLKRYREMIVGVAVITALAVLLKVFQVV